MDRVPLNSGSTVIAAILRIGEVEHGRRRAVFDRVSLAPMLREVADLHDPVAKDRGVALDLVLIESAAIMGDRDLLFEAAANLVDNAIKFSPAGGRCQLGLAAEGGTAVIRVDDAGSGIPKEERASVLKRFCRSERSRTSKGKGLGLSLVAALTRLHGFDLRIGDNHPGCRVEIRVPVVARDVALASPTIEVHVASTRHVGRRMASTRWVMGTPNCEPDMPRHPFSPPGR